MIANFNLSQKLNALQAEAPLGMEDVAGMQQLSYGWTDESDPVAETAANCLSLEVARRFQIRHDPEHFAARVVLLLRQLEPVLPGRSLD